MGHTDIGIRFRSGIADTGCRDKIVPYLLGPYTTWYHIALPNFYLHIY